MRSEPGTHISTPFRPLNVKIEAFGAAPLTDAPASIEKNLLWRHDVQCRCNNVKRFYLINRMYYGGVAHSTSFGYLFLGSTRNEYSAQDGNRAGPFDGACTAPNDDVTRLLLLHFVMPR